jgi:hypothetical protein
VMMRPFDNGDGIDLHVAEMLDGIQRARLAAPESGRSIQTLCPQGDGPGPRGINFCRAVQETFSVLHGLDAELADRCDTQNTIKNSSTMPCEMAKSGSVWVGASSFKAGVFWKSCATRTKKFR